MLEHAMTAELNTFFPFDPYKLPRSGSYIQGVYREWSSVAIDEDEEDESEDEDEDGEDGEAAGSSPVGIFINGTRPASHPDETEGLGESFGGMSISPARPEHLQQSRVIVV